MIKEIFIVYVIIFFIFGIEVCKLCFWYSFDSFIVNRKFGFFNVNDNMMLVNIFVFFVNNNLFKFFE